MVAKIEVITDDNLVDYFKATDSEFLQFIGEDNETYGSFEIWHELGDETKWYWWSCFPGCLPDSEYNGPFASREACIYNARFE